MIDEARVRDGLWPGEELLWIGRPRAGFHLLPGDLLRIPFMVAWTGFAVFWTLAAASGGPAFFVLWGLGFIAIGVGTTVWPWIAAARRATTTIYAVTSRRVLARADRGSSFELPIEGLPVSVFRQGRASTVAFTPNGGLAGLAAMSGFNSRRGSARPNAFTGIEDGDGALAALDAARAAAHGIPAAPPPPWTVSHGGAPTAPSPPETRPLPPPSTAETSPASPPAEPTSAPPVTDSVAPGWGWSPQPLDPQEDRRS